MSTAALPTHMQHMKLKMLFGAHYSNTRRMLNNLFIYWKPKIQIRYIGKYAPDYFIIVVTTTITEKSPYIVLLYDDFCYCCCNDDDNIFSSHTTNYKTIILHCSVPGDPMYNKVYFETLRSTVTVDLSSIYKPNFSASMEQLKLLRDLYYDTLIREMQMMGFIGVRCDRIG